MATQRATSELEVVNYPFGLSGKRQKKIFVFKGQDVVSVYMRTARCWKYEGLANLYQRMSRGGSFVEVGANVGTDTVLASDFFARCYAFEPLSKHTAIIRRNLEINGITNVQLFSVAVSDRCGKARIYFGQSGNSGSASLQPDLPGMDRFEEVETVTLDSALPDVSDATFIHIDAQGHDIKVLQGGRRFIAKQKQLPFIKMEFQPATLSSHGSQIAELIGIVEEFKYSILFNASNNFVPLPHGMLIDMFYQWRGTLGWIDIYLAPPLGRTPAAPRPLRRLVKTIASPDDKATMASPPSMWSIGQSPISFTDSWPPIKIRSRPEK